MSRAALSIALLFLAQIASAADLPPGAVARLGDDRFRAGDSVEHLAISPDGRQFVTAQKSHHATYILTVWDSDTGRPVREREINDDLFGGLVWGASGGFAIVIRGQPATGDKLASLVPDDFRVWQFTDPKAEPPPLLPARRIGLIKLRGVEAERPHGSAEYTSFHFSADGKRVAARLTSAAGGHAVHVFELEQASTTAKLNRAGVIDLGTEGADAVHLSADGRTLVAFRQLANDNVAECTATRWDVATGTSSKAVRVPLGKRFIVTPDARSLISFTTEDKKWGFDQYDLVNGKRRPAGRWQNEDQATFVPRDSEDGFAFTDNGRVLSVVVDCRTYVVDISAGKELGRLEGHARGAFAVAASADGARIATADDHGLIRLWDGKTFRPLHDAPGHRASVESAQLSPDGKRLITWGSDLTARLWDVATGKELRAFTGVRNQPTFTPDGTTILYSTDQFLIARDLQTGLEVPLPGELKGLPPSFAVFSPNGGAVLTQQTAVGDAPTCQVWDWPSGKKRFACSSRWSPGFSPDGSMIYSASTSPERRDAKTGEELPAAWKDKDEKHLTPLCALLPNPRWLIEHTDDDDIARVIEAGTGRLVPRFGPLHGAGVYEVAVAPTGHQFTGTGHPVVEQMLHQWLSGFQVGTLMALAMRAHPTILLHEAATGGIRRQFRGHRGRARVLGFTPDGTKLLTAGGDHTVLVWDVRLQSVPLPDTIKKETSAAKLWDTLASGKADAAYLAMSRLAREPEAAVKIVRMRLKPAARGDRETGESRVTDCRAIELLEALGTDSSRALLKELAAGHAGAFRTQEAKRAMERWAKK